MQTELSIEKICNDIRPIETAETLPASWYTSPEFLNLEKEIIFKNEWQYIGPVCEVKEAGQYVVTEIAGIPLIVVRGNDLKIRCFHNVCRHRGGPLALKDGKARFLQCQYHAWTYGLDGKLAGAPHMQDAKDFDKSNCKLPQASVTEWEGMIFVNLNPTPKPFPKGFSEIIERISPIKVSQRLHKRLVYDVESNWKAYVDNYLEVYHVPVIHPELTAALEITEYKTEIYDDYSLQHSPFSKKEDNEYGTTGPVFYYFFFPNIMLNILPGRVQMNSIIPNGVNRCKVIFDYFFDDQDTEADLKRINTDIEFSDLVQKQDADMCAHVQKALLSGSYHRGRFAPSQEFAVHHFQTMVKKAIAVKSI